MIHPEPRLTPPDDAPEAPPVRSCLPCHCGTIYEPFFELESPPRYEQKRVRVACMCGNQGPLAWDYEKAEDLWNAEVEEQKAEL